MWKRTKKYITNWAEDCIRSTWKQFSKWIIKAHWWAFMWMNERKWAEGSGGHYGAKIFLRSIFEWIFFVTNKFNKFCLFICNCFFFFHQNNQGSWYETEYPKLCILRFVLKFLLAKILQKNSQVLVLLTPNLSKPPKYS